MDRKIAFPIVLASVWILMSAFTLLDFAGFTAATHGLNKPADVAQHRP